MVKPIEWASIHLPLEEDTLKPGHKVLMDVEDNLIIFGDPEGILDQQLRPLIRYHDYYVNEHIYYS
jgi:hypothetical protein